MEFNRLSTESLEEYKNRLYSYKVGGAKITWTDIANLVNDEIGVTYSADKYRKEFSRLRGCNEGYFFDGSEIGSVSAALDDKLSEIRYQKTILSDIRNDANLRLRRLDRESHIKEIAKEFATIMASGKKSYSLNPIITDRIDDNAGLLLLSDWHYGIEIDDYFNKYNTDICVERLDSVLSQTIRVAKNNDISTIYVYNLSDLICGRIHAQLRLQSRIDAITQTMEVSELLYNFLSELSRFFNVEYYDCRDNHSRVEPNKKESLHLESFTRIIHWYLENRFEGNKRVSVHENLSDDIIIGDILGHRVVGVHGDNDKPNTAVNKLSSFLGERPDLVVMGHKHHFSADEKNECVLIMNPSLMGADRFALDLRETSKPAQTFIVLTKDNPVHAVYRLLAE